MVVALLRRVYTTLDLNLFKSEHDCHGIGFEVVKRFYLAHIRLADNTLNLFKSSCLLPEPACICGDEFRLCVSACVWKGSQRRWALLERVRRAEPGSTRLGQNRVCSAPSQCLWADRNAASGLHSSKWVLSSSRGVGKFKGDLKVFKWIRKEQLVVGCFICFLHSSR